MLNVTKILLAVVGLLGIAALACSSQTSTPPIELSKQPNPNDGGEIRQVNRIACVSPNGDLFTVDPDGGNLSQLTGEMQAGSDPQAGVQAQLSRMDEYYTWPTWSADGTKLAASRVIVREEEPQITLQVIDARSGGGQTIYENGLAGLVADGAPHYIYWAPSGDQLSFLASTPEGLALFVWDGTVGEPASQIHRGAPLYYQWAKDAQAMALHVGPDIIWAKPLEQVSSRQAFQSRGNFRVPAISPDGASLAYVDSSDGGMGVYVAPTDDLSQTKKIVDVGRSSAIMWSPDGTQIAVSDQSDPSAPLFDRLMLVPADGGPVTELVAEAQSDGIFGFFWAPTGDKIAWVSVNAAEQELEWVVAPKDGSDSKSLFSFKPSAEVFIMLSFFDQYAYSHSPWSPDGQFLVVAGSKGEAARRSNGRTPTGDRIYILDVEATVGPRDLGAGVLAVWSWN
jgi:Tol biopolymer transport system component